MGISRDTKCIQEEMKVSGICMVYFAGRVLKLAEGDEGPRV